MTRELDIIDWVIECIRRQVPEITDEMALHASREARKHWGGQRIDYVAKHCRADIEARRRAQGAKPVPAQALQQYIDGEPMAAIESEYGISRRTLYRAMKRR